MKDLDAQYLPESVIYFIEVIGFNATMKLISHWGGIRLRVPVSMKHDHILVERIGQRATRLLVKHFNGEEIPIPVCAEALRAARNSRIVKDAESKSAAEQAREHGLTERQVYSIRAADQDENKSPQADLFAD